MIREVENTCPIDRSVTIEAGRPQRYHPAQRRRALTPAVAGSIFPHDAQDAAVIHARSPLGFPAPGAREGARARRQGGARVYSRPGRPGARFELNRDLRALGHPGESQIFQSGDFQDTLRHGENDPLSRSKCRRE